MRGKPFCHVVLYSKVFSLKVTNIGRRRRHHNLRPLTYSCFVNPPVRKDTFYLLHRFIAKQDCINCGHHYPLGERQTTMLGNRKTSFCSEVMLLSVFLSHLDRGYFFPLFLTDELCSPREGLCHLRPNVPKDPRFLLFDGRSIV